MKPDLKDCLLTETNTVQDAINVLEERSIKGVFIVDREMHLLGIFTRGDLRRFFLQNGELATPLAQVMNRSPVCFYSVGEARIYSRNSRRIVYPIIDEEHRLTDVLYNTWDVIAEASESKCMEKVPLVIMAGGMGTRLSPLTNILPKALIPIGNVTITERIIKNFRAWGCNEVYLVLNHKASMVEAYFKDLQADYRIHFIKEERPLGTAGGLSLLRGMIDSTFILSNCDILVNADIDCVLKTHRMHKNRITMVGAYKSLTIPYGVIEASESGKVTSVREKPVQGYLANTGVYAIEPEVINALPADRACDITDLMETYRSQDRLGVFPVTENVWLDMGQFSELNEMVKALGIEDNA